MRPDYLIGFAGGGSTKHAVAPRDDDPTPLGHAHGRSQRAACGVMAQPRPWAWTPNRPGVCKRCVAAVERSRSDFEDIRQEGYKEYGEGGGCFWIAPEVERRWPEARAQSGTYAGDGHMWNVLPDGSIFDVTYGQRVSPDSSEFRLYQPDAEPVESWGPVQEPEFKPELHP